MGYVIRRQRDPAELLGALADETRHPDIGAVDANGLYPHRFVEQGAGDDLPLADGRFSTQWRTSYGRGAYGQSQPKTPPVSSA